MFIKGVMKEFELEIILELLRRTSNRVSRFLEEIESYEQEIYFSHVGYFLTLKNINLPKQRIVLDKPQITGKLGGIDVGFLVIIQDHQLTLECYSYDNEITEKNRNNGFEKTKT